MYGRSEGTRVITTTVDTSWRIACHTLTLSFCCTKILIVFGDTSLFRGTNLLPWTVRKVIELPSDFEDGVLVVRPDSMAMPGNAKSKDSWIRHATRCMLPHWAVDKSLLIRTRSVRTDSQHPAARQRHRNVRDVICSSSWTVSGIHVLNEKEKDTHFSNSGLRSTQSS
jgi:hypothetical protein